MGVRSGWKASRAEEAGFRCCWPRPGSRRREMSAPNILLVDDEPSVLRYIKTLLEIEDYQVETAGSGEEALQRMQRRPVPSLIVLDLLMPGMDGLQTLESCKKIHPE